MKLAGFVLLAATAAAQTAGTDQTGSVTGVVTDAVSHMPVKKATVTINVAQGVAGMGRNQGGQATVTDTAGAFTITNLQAGSYRLIFQHQNYPGNRSVTKSVDIKAGETVGPVTAELIPGAVVTGHVVDEDGDPMPNCNVQPHPAKNPERGVPLLGSTGSNEDGEYRIYGIAPGKYILMARCVRPMFQSRPFSAGPEPPPTQAYPVQYYPLTSEAKEAQVIELTPGTEKSGVDFRIRPSAVTQVHGVFSAGGADWHSGNLNVRLMPLDQKTPLTMGGGGAIVDQSKGTFEFRQVFPGSYMLVVFSMGGNESQSGAMQRIDVSDQPLTLAVELKHAIELSGKVEIETSANTTNPVSPTQINIQLLSQYQMFLPAGNTQVSEDGTFTLNGVIPAPWRLQANGPNVFVKSAWMGNTDVTNASLELSGGAAGTLRIVVSTNTATLRGSAPAGQMVMAQRAEEDLPFRPTRGTQVDQTGQYKLEGLAPGKYRLMLVDNGSPMPDEGGQEVTVQEGETVMLDLKAQPAP